RWREVALAAVPDRRRWGDLRAVALLFAELARNFPAWERGTEEAEMGESQVANGWRAEGDVRGTMRTLRRVLVETLDAKFPGEASPEASQLIERQDTPSVLDDWFRAALRAGTCDDFLQTLRR
ncbi:MAG: hypothetical protein ACRC33_25570, partial [Gemmataceae bacterium]